MLVENVFVNALGNGRRRFTWTKRSRSCFDWINCLLITSSVWIPRASASLRICCACEIKSVFLFACCIIWKKKVRERTFWTSAALDYDVFYQVDWQWRPSFEVEKERTIRFSSDLDSAHKNKLIDKKHCWTAFRSLYLKLCPVFYEERNKIGLLHGVRSRVLPIASHLLDRR